MMTSVKDISLYTSKEDLMKILKDSNYENVEEITTNIINLSSKSSDCKSFVDQVFREYLLQLVPKYDIDLLQKYISYNIAACRIELCSPSCPVILLSDIFDMSTLEFCENLFTFVEMNVYVWKEDLFFSACKNNLLRMCNDLLRRLSRSQNTVFCGRILLFLAQFFPFSERSGLNIISEFNIENVTDFNTDEDFDLSMNEKIDQDGSESRITVDFSLYSKFWYLQNFFRSPNDLYINQKWIMFCSYSKYVLSTLQSYKLDPQLEKTYFNNFNTESENSHRHFVKFLTNRKLLELQLSDSNFRRYILVQFLILFQYLTATVKSKSESYKLKPEQTEWIQSTTHNIYNLIKETSPDGENFLNIVEKILQREERWNNWKNESCPEVNKPNPAIIEFNNYERREKSHVGDILKQACAQKKYYLGHIKMTRLWNLKPDNLEACRSKERDFLPTLESYFEEAIMQADPSAMIESQYKKVNEMDYSWRGLRLLSQKCSHFFAQSNFPIHKMPDFLENLLNKINKDKPAVSGNLEDKIRHEPAETETQDVIISTDNGEEGEVVNDESQNQDDFS